MRARCRCEAGGDIRGAALRCWLLGQEIRGPGTHCILLILSRYDRDREERVIGDQTLVRGTGGYNEGHLVTVLHTIEISIYLIIHFEDPPYIKLLKHMSFVCTFND